MPGAVSYRVFLADPTSLDNGVGYATGLLDGIGYQPFFPATGTSFTPTTTLINGALRLGGERHH